MKFSERLRMLRLGRKLTQSQLAEAVGITERACRYYEAGDREPACKALIALADYFDIPMDFLLGRGIYEHWDALIAMRESLVAGMKSTIENSGVKYNLPDGFWDSALRNDCFYATILPLYVQKVTVEPDGNYNIFTLF